MTPLEIFEELQKLLRLVLNDKAWLDPNRARENLATDITLLMGRLSSNEDNK